EDRVDRPEYRRSRAKRGDQRQFRELLTGGADALSEILTYTLERRRGGALEAEDRLFGIADDEHRAAQRASAFAGEELLRQRRHHLPLLGIGVLRFVDEDVIDAAVELVEHPRRNIRALEKIARGEDEIVIVQQRAFFLQAAILAQDAVGKPVERGSRARHRDAPAQIVEREETSGFGSQCLLRTGSGGCGAGADQVLSDL